MKTCVQWLNGASPTNTIYVSNLIFTICYVFSFSWLRPRMTKIQSMCRPIPSQLHTHSQVFQHSLTCWTALQTPTIVSSLKSSSQNQRNYLAAWLTKWFNIFQCLQRSWLFEWKIKRSWFIDIIPEFRLKLTKSKSIATDKKQKLSYKVIVTFWISLIHLTCRYLF